MMTNVAGASVIDGILGDMPGQHSLSRMRVDRRWHLAEYLVVVVVVVVVVVAAAVALVILVHTSYAMAMSNMGLIFRQRIPIVVVTSLLAAVALSKTSREKQQPAISRAGADVASRAS
ncbi:hypothetical protein ACQEVF_27435 [Nonomuraea polychroma]|uniref:hypothetical protein n=1 Tax=Nonomuraea polychroma TaxID=46176 RepID=UPI003D94563E